MKVKVKILTVDMSIPQQHEEFENKLQSFLMNSWHIKSSNHLVDSKICVILQKDIIEVSG